MDLTNLSKEELEKRKADAMDTFTAIQAELDSRKEGYSPYLIGKYVRTNNGIYYIMSYSEGTNQLIGPHYCCRGFNYTPIGNDFMMYKTRIFDPGYFEQFGEDDFITREEYEKTAMDYFECYLHNCEE